MNDIESMTGRSEAQRMLTRPEGAQPRRRRIFDTHAHYTDRRFAPGRDALLEALPGQGVALVLTCGENIADSRRALALARAWPYIYAACGTHPHQASGFRAEEAGELRKLLRDERCLALGEIGLDYHYDFSPREAQRDCFRRQLELVHQYQLPAILHLREAHPDALAILEQSGWPEHGVLLHCYTLGPEELIPWLEKGADVAFGGTLTFKNATSLRQAACLPAIQRIMTETDAPFMTPEPLRGTLCGPEHTLFTAARLVEALGVSDRDDQQTVLSTIYANALRFFELSPQDLEAEK